MRLAPLLAAVSAFALCASAAQAEGISTHVLDLAQGVGGRDLPVTLAVREADGKWRDLGTAKTDENGRVKSFGDAVRTQAAVYRLTFDMGSYGEKAPFFPEIVVVFKVADAAAHYHVPIVFSPYGYSTYRGN